MSGLNFVLSHASLTILTSSSSPLLVLLPLSSPQTLLEAQELRLVFDAHELLQQDDDDGNTDHQALRLRLIVGFLAFLLESTTTPSSASSTSRFVVSRATRDELLRVTFEALNKAVINDAEDVHIVLKNKPEALRIYLHARHELAIKKTSSSELPFLLKATPSSFGGYSKMAMSSHIQEEPRRKGVAFVQFGGQGTAYFDELRKTFRMYPEAKKLISSSLESLAQELKKRKDELDPYTFSMVDTLFLQGNLLKWLSTGDASTVQKERLSDVALAYAPLSYPLICLTQLSGCFTYLSHLLEKLFFSSSSSSSSSTLEKLLLDAFHSGATGHSQGICAAVVFASSKTPEEFMENTSKMIRYLFWQGYRSQIKFNLVSSASPALASPSTLGSSSLSSPSRSSPSTSSSPTPMMAILKLPVAEVSRRITEFNKRKTNPSELLDLALVNGPTATVLASGSVESLKEFDKILRTPAPAPIGGKAPPPPLAEINRDRVPFSKRKLELLTVFLMVSAPFHCPSIMTQDVVDAIASDLWKSGLETAFESKNLLIPVFSTFDGTDLRIVSSSSSSTEVSPLLLELIHLQSSKRVNWAAALSSATLEKGVRCIIDFGPTAEGSATLSARVKDGQGIQVIQASEYDITSSTSLEEAVTSDNMVLGKDYLFADTGSRLESAFRAFYAQNTRHWINEFAPRLVKVRSPGSDQEKLMIDTKFSRLIGKPPVMVAGMTPTTVSVDFVAAILNAGFHVELAGGGLVRETIFRQSIDRLMDLCVNNGEGICLNLLFLNAKQWGFQFPLIKQLVKVEGVPIESITIAAGLPTLEKANEIVEELREVGVRYISFKPSSTTTILETITIAKANPKMQFVLQWTGGRAGGHHSFEDAHQPILETYAQIRRTPNLSLIMGSGLGNAESALPYLTGEWSTPAYPAMPFDGVMLASRVMIAKEADTSLPVKEMISKVKGVTNELDWEQSYEASAGGIITVLSELEEAIHVVENKCTLLWRELDKKIFSLPLGEQEKALELNKSWIIQRLNSDYQKLYFPIFKKHANGTSTAELSGMTYEEIARRLVELMYILPSTSTNSKRTGWIDPSFCELTLAFLHRIEERFLCSSKVGTSVLSFEKLWKEPHALLQDLFYKYTLAKEQLAFPQDVDFFLSLCAPLPTRRGKPVNFVPVIDKNFKYYFKKDSLWYSEFIEAVPHRDPERVFVLQGPVAVRYSNIVDEEVKHILSSVTQEILDRLSTTQQTSTLNIVDYLRLEDTSTSEIQDTGVISSHNSEATITLAILDDGVTFDKWMTTILAAITQRTNSKTSWVQALLSSTTIVRGKRRVDNSIRQLFAPFKSKRVVVTFDKTNASKVEVFQDTNLEFTLSYTNALIALCVVYSIPGTESQSNLSLDFKYCPAHPYSLIQEDPTQRCQRVKDFYSKVWSISDISRNEITQGSRFTYNFTSEPYVVTRKELQEFCSSTTLRLLEDSNSQLQVPFDFAIVAAWTPLVKALFVDVLSQSQTDLLDLVHLSNSYKRCEPLVYVKEGDVLSTTLHLVKLSNSKSGKIVTVRGVISKLSAAGNQDWIELESTFFIRGLFFDHVNSFREEQRTYRLVLEKEREIALITSKPWILLPGNTPRYTLDNLLIPDYQLEDPEDGDPSEMDLKDTLLPEDELTFDLFVQEKYFDESKLSNVHVSGPITRIRTGKGGVKEKSVIGKLDYTFSSSSPLEYLAGNIPLEFLNRLQATTSEKEHIFESGYHLLSEVQVYNAPLDNLPYALASRDYNPIHMNKSISVLANLPDTIVHGMWTSAYAKTVLEDYVSRINLVESRKANGWQDITEYSVEFQGMVLPNDKLYTQLKHVGMRGNGDKIVEIEVVNQQGETVLKGRAIVAPPPTAYLFTGQGTAEVNMGMELYASSPAARKIWDSADRILLDKFGFSILEIVRKNPKTLTVHFGGRKGAAIRESYLNLQQEKTVTHADGTTTVERVQMIPEVTPTSLSYTFTSDQGLLFSTQFTQPAIVLFEKAAWEDMKSNGLIPTRGEHLYAGHSLGEYAVLCTAAESVPIERVVVVCFIRGLTMQRVVQRDSKGRSNFAMVAVDPSRVHVGFSEDYLHAIVDFIEEKNSTPVAPALLQVVNYNVDRCQYVVAGDLSSLDVLSTTLTEIKKLAANPAALRALTNREEIEKIVRQAISTTQGKLQASVENRIVLERGAATIPLRGIDVPFHSKYLLGGVQAFRERLSSMIGLEAVSPDMLIGRYIPNLVAQPFSLDRNYIELVQKKTGSSVLLDLLQKNDEELKGSATRRVIARFLLIELLAYQFASPVLWIETQHQIFFQKGVRRLVEVGPAATLTTMAKNTLLIKKKVEPTLEVLPIDSCCVTGAQAGEVYYRCEDQGPAAAISARSLSLEEVPSEEFATLAPSPITKPAVIPPTPVAASVQQTISVPPTSSAPISSPQPHLQALEVLKTIVALNTKKTFQECGSDKSIKDLVGGKSALQNQIVGELQKEFEGSVESLENVSEMNLTQLATAVSSGSPSLGLGKTTLGLVSKFISRKMPGGVSFNNFKEMIQVDYDGVSLEGVILHSLLHEPKARFENEEEMKKWIETTVIPSYGSVVLNRVVNKRSSSVPSSFFAAAPQTHFQVAFPTSSPTAIEDQKVRALDFIRVLLALKLKKGLSEIQVDKSIGDIVGSKSALRNEIIGDMEKEFGSGTLPETSAEASLQSLGEQLDKGYSSLGKHSLDLLSKLFSQKMPAGFNQSQAKSYLSSGSSLCLLPEGRIQSVLLHSLSIDPPKRLTNEPEAMQWLDSVVKSYAQFHGVNLSSPSVQHNSSVAPMNTSTQVAVSNVDTKRLAQLFKDQLEGLNEYFDIDSRTGDRSFEKEKERSTNLQSELDRLIQEFGTEMLEGCRPIFDAPKQRKFNSWWNWNRQDILELYFKVCASGDVVIDHEAWKQRRHVLNTATRELVDINAYYVEKAKREGRNEIVISNAENLLEAVRDNVNRSPVYCLQSHSYKMTSLTGPKVEINPKTGQLEYKEDQRPGIDLFIDYVASIKAQLQVIVEKEARHISSLMQVHKVALEGVRKAINNAHPRFRSQHRKNQKRFSPSDRSPCHRSPAGSDMGSGAVTPSALATEENPVIFIENREIPTAISVDVRKTNTFLTALETMCKDGVNFSGKTALVTGGGRGSIGVEIVKALLDGGAKVFVTTSSYSEEVCTYYRKVYQQHGSKGSELTVVPWNAASRQDIDALVSFIYGTEKEDLDFLVPFAALSQVDKDISELDSKTELASRLMFNNVLRLVGKIKKEKERKQQEQGQTACTRPCHVILPLSPNHGQFGRDGFYAETKLALEGLMNKWKSESWGGENGQITLVGAIIGWTRGTGLMNDNNLIASGFEKLGARTFTTGEMAFNIVGLLHPSVVSLATTDPLWCNLTGGFEKIENLQKTTNDIRDHLRNRSGLVKDILNDEKKDQELLKATSSLPLVSSVATTVEPRMNLRSNFPILPSQERLEKLQQEVNLKGVIDLEKVVVVTGFGEVGPFGSSRNRWEVECYGEFSVEGCIELAWVTGLIKYHSGTLSSSTQFYSGWVDAKTGAPVSDIQVKPKYEKVLLERSGIRLIEPEINDGYDPEKKQFLRQVIVTRDLDPVELGDNEEEAQMFKRENGDRVDIWEEAEKKTWWLKMRKGAVLFVPKAMKFDRLVSSQIPSGWTADRYGVPKEIQEQVDPVTLYALVSTMEALIASGVTDPYEFFEYVHVSEVGNTSGGGVGGARSLSKMFKQRLTEKPVQGDILQETFINVIPAWINLLLLSASGPIKTPVGACATAAESVDIAVDTIRSGRAKIVVVGGFDDFIEEASFEFGNMKATSSAEAEFAKGRTPREMSRPMTTTRAGFMESHGAGIQILMSADVALEMGVPIYAIVALSSVASDKEGRSVPAPGQGILTTAKETRGSSSPLLDLQYRRQAMESERERLLAWRENMLKGPLGANNPEFVDKEYERMLKASQSLWGNEFFKNDPTISPLRGALNVFGLGIDDIHIASFHGTSTQANDYNESSVIQQQMEHLGRTKGNVLYTIAQKWLTGHPKGGAAAWMMNGLIQSMLSGIIPGNRNADNIDEKLRKFDDMVYFDRTLHTNQYIKACYLKSFGFGQAGAEIVLVHPDYVFALVDSSEFEAYKEKRGRREQQATKYLNESMTSKRPFISVKTSPPYTLAQESSVYLNPQSRAIFVPEQNTWRFVDSHPPPSQLKKLSLAAKEALTFSSSTSSNSFTGPSSSSRPQIERSVVEMAQELQVTEERGIGVDVEPLSDFYPRLFNTSEALSQTFEWAQSAIADSTFVQRNYTEVEIQYCLRSSTTIEDLCAKFTGRWCAKEAVIKALTSADSSAQQTLWRSSSAGLKEIEIRPTSSGAPLVVLVGHAAGVAQKVGVKNVKLSISHSGDYAIALAATSS